MWNPNTLLLRPDPHGVLKNIIKGIQRVKQRNAYKKLKQQLKKESTMEFKIGDKVRAKKWNSDKVYTILDAKYTDMVNEQVYLIHTKKPEEYWFTASNLEIVDLIKEPKFNIGDRVKIIDKNDPSFYKELFIITIITHDNNYLYQLSTITGCVWGNYKKEQLELVEDEKPKIETVAKCIDNKGFEEISILNDKYYIAEKNSQCKCCYKINGYFLCKDQFKIFKVGDRFKCLGPIKYRVIIKDFEIINKDIFVHIEYETGMTSKFDMTTFENAYTKIEDEPEKKEPELKVGDYVEILEDCKMIPSEECVLTYYAREFNYTLESSIGKIGKVARIYGDEIEVIDLPKECYRYNTFWPFGRNQLKKVDKPKPEWQPKFKVGDWIVNEWNAVVEISQIDIHRGIYYYKIFWKNQYYERKVEAEPKETIEKYWEYWQPMQDLKLTVADLEDKLAMEKGKIEELKGEIELLSKIRVAQAEIIRVAQAEMIKKQLKQ